MFQIAQKSIGVLDVPDLSKQEAAIAVRKATLGDAEYEGRYRGLDHLVGLYWYQMYGFSSQWLFIVIGLHILIEGRVFGYSDPLENRWNSIILCCATIAVVTLTTLRPASESLSDMTVLFILITQSLIWVSGIKYLWDAREYIIKSFELKSSR